MSSFPGIPYPILCLTTLPLPYYAQYVGTKTVKRDLSTFNKCHYCFSNVTDLCTAVSQSLTNHPNSLVVGHCCNLACEGAFQDSSLRGPTPTCMYGTSRRFSYGAVSLIRPGTFRSLECGTSTTRLPVQMLCLSNSSNTSYCFTSRALNFFWASNAIEVRKEALGVLEPFVA